MQPLWREFIGHDRVLEVKHPWLKQDGTWFLKIDVNYVIVYE